MYLIDTNVISELRKQQKADAGVKMFFQQAAVQDLPLFISVITVGELRRGVEMMRHRGDIQQATLLEQWLVTVIGDYAENILEFGELEAQVWGRLRVPNYENALDKQIAATALTHDLRVVTRNVEDFADTGVKLLNPFSK
jgi:predicted nucleic acid-binding protein